MRDIYKLERVFEGDDFSFRFVVYGEAIIEATSMWQLYHKISMFYKEFYDDELYRNAIDLFFCDFSDVASEFNTFQKKIVEARAVHKKEYLDVSARELPF